MASAPEQSTGRKRKPKTSQAREPVSILDNSRYFPSFENLPGEYDADERSYYDLSDPPIAMCKYSWCFLGEIVNDDTAQISFLRNGVHVRDRAGKDSFVAFYPKEGSFDFKMLKKGNTLCILFALKHAFLDLRIGLRIEDLDEVKVIPCGLDQVFLLSRQYFRHKDSCWGCGYEPPKTETPDNTGTGGTTGGDNGDIVTPVVKLLKCAKCKTAVYCNKECQTKDWKERHRDWCRAIPSFLQLVSIDYTTYGRDSHF